MMTATTDNEPDDEWLEYLDDVVKEKVEEAIAKLKPRFISDKVEEVIEKLKPKFIADIKNDIKKSLFSTNNNSPSISSEKNEESKVNDDGTSLLLQSSNNKARFSCYNQGSSSIIGFQRLTDMVSTTMLVDPTNLRDVMASLSVKKSTAIKYGGEKKKTLKSYY
mmetsp:Transcript_42819/g.48657  ORF Transcript_42819/g.48657 Transcript_42819/m.48657 type:complete len:164 (+) Transcript_42819:88-579(+)